MAKNFLIVDDSLVSRMMTKSVIGKLRPDWVFFEANTGMQAIATCADQPIDIVCMDLNMPGITGIEAAAEIHKHNPAIRITIMTANVQSAIQTKIQQHGLAFMAKPLTENKGPELLKVLGE